MFSVKQKRQIADAVQQILRETSHPELPVGEISFCLYVDNAENWSWAVIENNGAVTNPGVNPWNEAQAHPFMQQPVAVSERLPGAGDCDAYEYCWFWTPCISCWEFRSRNRRKLHDTHWLPHYALPTPAGEVAL